MNPLELRYEIYKPLAELVSTEGPLAHIEKLSPVPGEPVAIEVTAQDPFSHPGAVRRYRVTIEETTEESADPAATRPCGCGAVGIHGVDHDD